MTTETKHAELRELLDAATSGPWKSWHGDIIADGDLRSDYDDYVIAGIGVSLGSRSSVYCPIKAHTPAGKANAALIVHLRNNVEHYIAQDARIAELEAENARLKDNIAFYGRWIERGRYDEAITPEGAISVMVHYPGAPWKVGRWDVDDKPYAKRFYSDHPKARAALGEQQP